MGCRSFFGSAEACRSFFAFRGVYPSAVAARRLLGRSVVSRARRNFFGQLAMYVSLALSYGAAAAFAARYLYPKRRPPRWRSLFVTRLDHLSDGESRVIPDLKGVPVQVLRDGANMRALSTVCPHLGCRVRWQGDQQRFFCPCHNGVFDREGKVVSGPPPRPLDRYDVEVIEGSVYLKVKEPA
jgi:nitrite reductase/ring-hydroxylating ferredoxin subunit